MIFKRLKAALQSLQDDMNREKGDFQTSKNIMDKIDYKIIKKFQKSTQKKIVSKPTLENGGVEFKDMDINSEEQSPSPRRKKKESFGGDEYQD